MNQKQAMLSSIEALLGSFDKGAEAYTEPGSIGGETSHPIKNVDDHAQAGTTGARDAEYKADLKEQQGSMGVDAASDPPAGGQEAQAETIGPLAPKSTGKDPGVEDDFKDTKEDPGSDHDARTDNNSLDGKKFASDAEHFSHLAKQAEKVGSVLLADMSVYLHAESKKAEASKAAPKAAAAKAAPAKATKKKAEDADESAAHEESESDEEEKAEEAKEAAAAGYDLAGLFADFDVPNTDKQACDHLVVSQVKNTIKQAAADADAVAKYLTGYFQERQSRAGVKAAEGEEGHDQESGSDDEPKDKGDQLPDDQGGAGPSDQGMPGEEELLAMLAGAGGGDAGGGGGDMGGAMGGGDPTGGGAGGGIEALLGGGAGAGDPMGGPPPGGDPMGGGGAPGGAPGGDQISPEDLALLEQVLQEMGQDPAAVQKAAMQKAAAKKAAAAKANPKLAQKKAALRKMVSDLMGIRS